MPERFQILHGFTNSWPYYWYYFFNLYEFNALFLYRKTYEDDVYFCFPNGLVRFKGVSKIDFGSGGFFEFFIYKTGQISNVLS